MRERTASTKRGANGGQRSAPERVPLATVAREWTRIGVTGFGGPPAHISLLRRLVVERERWMDARAFEDAVAACNLLPGPASSQLMILCAYRLAGWRGAVLGGVGFILPAVAMVLALSVLFLASGAPTWVRGASAGAGAAVAAVAVRTGLDLLRPSLRRGRADHRSRARAVAYLTAGALAAALIGPELVLVLLGCGVLEVLIRRGRRPLLSAQPGLLAALPSAGGFGALAWTSFKVGALTFGGGFVIIPLMQGDAVHTYNWMTGEQFLTAVALGQVTPGPVVATVAAVGYAAHGVAGSLFAAAVAFAPSFAFVLLAGGHFERLRGNPRARSFLDGAGPAANGAILGSSIPLAAALVDAWQAAVLAGAAVFLLVLRRGVVTTLLGAGVIGVGVALAGGPLP